ncbi:MAG: ABC transporter substrate-binding protein [Armatimonadetes bacterium]|nr:ABC transporter substrate-binding protein [Armatimonadota bacterium]
MNLRQTLALLCVAASLLLAPGCAKKSNEPVVGVYLALTGKQADFGITTRQGVELAAEEINSRQGINGKKLKFVFEDDRGDPAEARTAVSKLIDQEGAVAILGDVASKNSIAAGQVCQQREIPMISPSSTNPRVTQDRPYVFRVCFIDPFQGYVMAKFAADNLKVHTAAVLWDNSQDYSVGLAKVFLQEFPKMGGKIVAQVNYQSDDQDFSSQLTKIRAANPDVIYVPGYYSEVALIARKARELGIKVPLLGGDGWTSPTLVQRSGGALYGSYMSDHYSAESEKPAVKQFVEAFKAKFHTEPNSLAALGYDATWILADAMKRAGDFKPKDIRDQIAATRDYPGVTGNITINSQRNAVKSAVVLKIGKDRPEYFTTIDPPK